MVDFANDQELFFENWDQSFLKLTSVGVKSGDEGEIRISFASTNAQGKKKWCNPNNSVCKLFYLSCSTSFSILCCPLICFSETV